MNKSKIPHNDPIAMIAHKMRTPLTVIISTVNNLLDGAIGKISDDQRKWLKKLDVHSKNLDGQLNDLLSQLRGEPQAKAKMVQDAMEGKPIQPKLAATAAASPTFDWDKIAQKDPPPSILIVDDEPDVLDIIQEGMKMKNLRTTTFDNGTDALAHAIKNPPDLILLDVCLKDMNGLELCQKIKTQLPVFVPVILVTGQNDLADKFPKNTVIGDDFLMKPFMMRELYARVASMLRLKWLTEELEQTQKKAA